MEFKFPDTGEGVTEGKFLEWKVDRGDEVEEDQVVGEAETDKAVVEIPAPSDAVVEQLKAEPGDEVEVGDVIMILDTGEKSGSENEDSEDQEGEKDPGEGKDTEEEKDQGKEDTKEESKEEESSPSDVLALPKVRKLAEEKGVNLAEIKTGERITEEEVRQFSGSEDLEDKEKEDDQEEEQEEEHDEGKDEKDVESVETPEDVKATPSVRKLARENEVDLSRIEGSGRGGKITREDVLDSAEGNRKSDQKVEPDSDSEEKVEKVEAGERVELSKVRRTVGERMKKARFTAPHVTHFDTADVTELVELRENKKEDVEAHLTYLPFIIKAVQIALEKHPRVNSELDKENNELVLKDSYDFNIAADTERGLMIPLVEEVDEKNIVELAEEIQEKAEKARSGELEPGEMRNGTFSITNLGAIGGEEFTPIINYPQAAMLGIGKIQREPRVIDGDVVPRQTVKLSFSYDHRILDGGDAARFINEVIRNLANPENMILEL